MKQKILLIDDDKITLELVEHILEEIDVGEITALSSSIEAMELLSGDQADAFDLVVCDWEMPVHNGLGLLQALRANNRKTPFLMLTANATRECVVTAVKAGVTDYIAKPFKNVDLVAKVKANLPPI